MTKTSALPVLAPAAHVEVAEKVAAVLAGFDAAVFDSLPGSVRETFDYLVQVTEAARLISSAQPEALAGYRDDMLDVVRQCEDPEQIVDALLASHVLAALVNDVASGKVKPVVSDAGKPARRAASRRTPAKIEKAAETSTRKPPVPSPPVSPVVPEVVSDAAPGIPVLIPEAPVRFDQSPGDDF